MTTTVLIIIALLHTPAVWVIAGAAAVAALITHQGKKTPK